MLFPCRGEHVRTVKPPLSGPPIYGHLPLPGRLYVRACASYNLARFASGPAMASKRKRSVMSLEKKFDIITQIRQGRSQRAVADGFGVAKSTVGDIWKNREKIEIHVSASTNPAFAKKRCIVRDAHFHKLDLASHLINVANICTMHAIYGFSELRTFLTYGHPSVPCCPDKGGLTVPIFRGLDARVGRKLRTDTNRHTIDIVHNTTLGRS